MSLAVSILLMASALQDISTPRTVNGIQLGPIEDFQTRGPGRVCLEEAAFDLTRDESATLQYSGIHSASFVVTSPPSPLVRILLNWRLKAPTFPMLPSWSPW